MRRLIRLSAGSGLLSGPSAPFQVDPGLEGKRSRDEGPLSSAAFRRATLRFRRREWGPAIDSAGIARPARIYDLRSTFISNALASGLTIFEVARIAGTSTAMVESRYGALLDSALESLLERLELRVNS